MHIPITVILLEYALRITDFFWTNLLNLLFHGSQLALQVGMQGSDTIILTEKSVERTNAINELLAQRTILIVILLGLLMVTVLLVLRARTLKQRAIAPSGVATTPQHMLLTEYFRGMEDERSWIAKELHDGSCSALAGARNMLEKKGYEDPHIMEVRRWLHETQRDLRNLSHNLTPPNLFEANLEQVTSELIARLSKQKGKMVTLTTSSRISWSNVDLASQLHVYRITQELLHNILTHSDATQVDAILSATEETIDLILEDNSTNYQQEKGNGIGSRNIANRVQLVSGTLEVRKMECGAVFHLSIPTARVNL